jgi:hypothetical protein
MPPTQNQSYLAIVTNPNPPPKGKITFVPNSTNFYVGEQITITTYVQNTSAVQIACQVEFFVNRAGSGLNCDPLHINSDVYNSPNPTPALVLNPGTSVPAAFVWIIDQAYGSTSIYAQVRATDCGPLDVCSNQPWNARRGCTILSNFLSEDARLQQPAIESLYCSLGITNPGDNEIETTFTVEAVREDEAGAFDLPDVRYLRSLGGSWLDAEARQLKLVLGTDRLTVSERGRKTRLEHFKMLSSRDFGLLRDRKASEGEAGITARLGGGEVRQALLEVEQSHGAKKKDFYVVRVHNQSSEKPSGDHFVVLRCDHEF